VEIAGLENGGPDLQGWKTRDNRLWNAKCLLMHKMQFQRTLQNTYCTYCTYCTLQSIKCNWKQLCNMLQVTDTRFAKALIFFSGLNCSQRQLLPGERDRQSEVPLWVAAWTR